MTASMKWIKWGGLAVASAMLVAASSGMDGAASNNTTVTISGVGYDSQPTDYLQISATTSVFAQSASAAMEENARITERLRRQLRRSGVEDEDFSTGQFTFGEGRDPRDRSRDREDGFIVSHGLQILIRRPDEAGPIMDALVDAGVTNLSLRDGRWGLPVSPEAAARARRQAVSDAMAKAEDFATALDMQLVRVVSLNEGGAHITDRPPAAMALSLETNVPTEISTNVRTVQASVSVVVELEKPQR